MKFIYFFLLLSTFLNAVEYVLNGDIRGGFSNPGGVAIDEATGNIYVSDTGNDRVVVFDENFTQLFTFNTNLTDPMQGSISDNKLFIADRNGHKVVVFDLNGNFLFQFGSLGAGNGQFNAIPGLTSDATQVYTADRENTRVQIFDLNGNFIDNFPVLDRITSISVVPAGNIYVADRWNDRILIYSQAGVFINQFGVSGTGDGQFMDAAGVTVKNGNVYVSDFFNNRVQVFDLTGNYVDQFSSFAVGNSLNKPRNLAVDDSGKIYVADKDNNRIIVLKEKTEDNITVDINFTYPSSNLRNDLPIAELNNIYLGETTQIAGVNIINTTGGNLVINNFSLSKLALNRGVDVVNQNYNPISDEGKFELYDNDCPAITPFTLTADQNCSFKIKYIAEDNIGVGYESIFVRVEAQGYPDDYSLLRTTVYDGVDLNESNKSINIIEGDTTVEFKTATLEFSSSKDSRKCDSYLFTNNQPVPINLRNFRLVGATNIFDINFGGLETNPILASGESRNIISCVDPSNVLKGDKYELKAIFEYNPTVTIIFSSEIVTRVPISNYSKFLIFFGFLIISFIYLKRKSKRLTS